VKIYGLWDAYPLGRGGIQGKALQGVLDTGTI